MSKLIIKNDVCEIENKECGYIESCRYLQHRFGVKENPCMNKEERKKIIEEKHKEELEERQKLI